MSDIATRIAALPPDKRAVLLEAIQSQRTPAPTPSQLALLRYRANPDARLRVFCFPYAGGGASVFRQWVGHLPPELELCGLQLPGRESRLAEQAHRSMDTLLDEICAVIQPELDRPFAFFGHSMGALVAFALTRRLRACGGPQPVQLYLSAYRAPQRPNPNIRIYHLPAEVFKVVLRAEGIAESILQNEELMQAMLPTLRADLELCDTFRYTAEPPLDCPLAIFGGTEDVRVHPEDLEGWGEHTAAGCTITLFPGAHFFLHSAQDQLLATLAADLKGHLRAIR